VRRSRSDANDRAKLAEAITVVIVTAAVRVIRTGPSS
jgi:hypothetical protein